MKKEKLRNWGPKRGKKIMGIPEVFAFVIVMVFVVLVLAYLAGK